MTNLLKIADFSFSYKKQRIYQKANFSIEQGQLSALVGPNGSGKTTLFQQLAYFIPRKSLNMAKGIDKNDIVLMSQSTLLPERLTVKEFVQLFLRVNNSNFHNIDQLVENWNDFEVNRFKEMLDRPSAKCSVGEKKWLYLRLIISLRKKIYLLDEPTAGVDPEYRHLIWQLLKNSSKKGQSFVVSSHLLDELEESCDKFNLILDGKILTFNSSEELNEATKSKNLENAFLKVYSKSGAAVSHAKNGGFR